MFSDITEVWNHDPVKEITNKISNGEFENRYDRNYQLKNNSINLSDIESISLLSDKSNTENYHGYAPAKFDRRTNFDIFSESSPINSKCSFSIRHLNKCDRCYSNLRQLINSKVNKKFDELLLENKLKQLRNQISIPTVIQQPVPYLHYNNSSWKETLIIMVGAIISIFIVFLIVKIIFK